MRFLTLVLLMCSWIVLLIAIFGAIAGGWFYYGYTNMDCHPMFATAEKLCGIPSIWASEHAMLAGRAMLPYGQVLADQQENMALVAGLALAAALLVQFVYGLVRRRRKRRMGVFADVRGFQPIETTHDK